MKRAARLFLERKLTRRGFVSRLSQLGISAAAACGLAGSLEAERGSSDGIPAGRSDSTSGRVIEGMTGGEVMAEFLLEWKVPYVFGLGGSEEVGFLDALVDRVALHFVTGLHEGSVMSMADGYARASGTPPLVLLHSIAGAGYAFGPMVNAFKDRIPL